MKNKKYRNLKIKEQLKKPVLFDPVPLPSSSP